MRDHGHLLALMKDPRLASDVPADEARMLLAEVSEMTWGSEPSKGCCCRERSGKMRAGARPVTSDG